MFDYQSIESPCYVLEERLLIKNLELIKGVIDKADVDIILALKGFSMYSTFGLVKQYLKGATASSLNEARLIFEEMKCKAHVYSPAYLSSEFDELCKYSSHITFNSINQFEKFKEKALLHNISIGLRINPQYAEVETQMYNPCIAGSRLGITRNQLPDTLPKEIEGLHFHTLCENDSFTLERTLNVVKENFGDLLKQVKWLNMGGGHLMTKAGYDVNHLVNLLKKFKEEFPNLKIILEPGSAIGWQTGFLISEVQDIIDSQGINVAILDVSFAAHMPDTLEMPYKPVVRGAFSETNPELPTYLLGGMTCLAGDFMTAYSFEKPLEIGQKVIFEDMIHYTMVKTTTFNGVGLPSIGIIGIDDYFRLHKKFGFEVFKEKL